MSNPYDYSKFMVGNYTQQLFDRFKDSDTAEFTREEFEVLKGKKLVRDEIDGRSGWFDDLPAKGVCHISGFGKGLRIYQRNKSQVEKLARVRFWVPIVISNVIAIAALAVAIIALLKQ